jgi:branched-subunit amino acid transport protein AzlD
LEVLLKLLTGIWPFIILTIEASAQVTDWYLGFIILTVGGLLKSLSGMYPFIILAVGVLVISLTSIWPFIILTIGGSAHITDRYQAIYYTNF